MAAPKSGHRITEEILKKTLAGQFGVQPADVQVKEFDVSAGSNVGDNYACEMKAVEVVADVRGREDGGVYHYMAKCIPMDKDTDKLIRESNVFETEMLMYTDLMPKFRLLEPRLMSPETYYADVGEGVMMMENLKKKGYGIVGRERGVTGLQWEEYELIFSQLSWLHAVSFHHIQTYPGGGEKAFRKDYPTMSSDNWFDTSNEAMAQVTECFFGGTDDAIVAIVKEFASDRPDLVKRVKEFTGKTRQTEMDRLHTKMGMFNCLLHNDSWFNNYMFKHGESGKATDIKTLDLQLSRIARPAIDLVYFIGSSMTPKFRKDHLEELLKFYYGLLSSKLRELGYDPDKVYPEAELRKDIKECVAFRYPMSLMHAMIHLTPGSMDIELMARDPKKFLEVFTEKQVAQARKSEAMRTRVLELVEEAAQDGII